MATLNELLHFLEQFAPLELSEEWDNTGLLIDNRHAINGLSRVMTCLTLTPDVADEAIANAAELVITHHPILFRSIQRLTTETTEGEMLLKLITAGIAVYSPHTSYDSATAGINQQLAMQLNLQNIGFLRPVETADAQPLTGAGRFGDLATPLPLEQLNQLVKQNLKIDDLQFIGNPELLIERVGIACGAAAEFMHDAARQNCNVLLTGEARFHACLEARSQDMALIIPGHYATERFAMETLAETVQQAFPDLNVWSSNVETDPVHWG